MLGNMLPDEEMAEFDGALLRAARALEMLRPARGKPGQTSAPAGNVMLLLAGAERSAGVMVPLSGVDGFVEFMRERIAKAPRPVVLAKETTGVLRCAAQVALEEFGSDGPMPGGLREPITLGLMLEHEGNRHALRQIVGLGLVPAVICLLSQREDKVALFAMVHGEPVFDLAKVEAVGSA
jgi:hypothetical protein